jgi:predicted membrane protein
MMQRIRRMDVMQMAKTLGALYLLLGLIIGVPVMFLMSAFAKTQPGLPAYWSGLGLTTIIVMPVIYGVFGFIAGAIMAALYNVVAGLTGGIGIDLE